MFKVLEGHKRRAMSPAAMAASIAAHLLLLGGAAYAAASDAGPAAPAAPESDTTIVFVPVRAEPAPPPMAEPAPEQPSEPDAPAPVPGEALEVSEVKVSGTMQPEAPGVQPVNVDDFNRDGRRGDVIGTPPVIRTRPSGAITPRRPEPFVPNAKYAEEQPVLDREGLTRIMERYYPPTLRESRVAGRVVVELIVDENGRVREGSARVMETTHPAFAEATLHAVERFRFRPAKMAGIPVAVSVTIPISWTVPE
jgi:TonB family protein